MATELTMAERALNEFWFFFGIAFVIGCACGIVIGGNWAIMQMRRKP